MYKSVKLKGSGVKSASIISTSLWTIDLPDVELELITVNLNISPTFKFFEKSHLKITLSINPLFFEAVTQFGIITSCQKQLIINY